MFTRLIISRSWISKSSAILQTRNITQYRNFGSKKLIFQSRKYNFAQQNCAFSISPHNHGILDFWGEKTEIKTDIVEKLIQFDEPITENADNFSAGNFPNEEFAELPNMDISGVNIGGETFGDKIDLISSLPDATTLADFGLGGSILPHRLFQDILDYLHTTMGLEWIGAIALLTIILRTIAIPSYIAVRSFSVRSANLHPHHNSLLQEVHKATKRGDNFGRKKAQMEYMSSLQKNKVNPFRILILNLPNMVIFSSMFFGLRQMCNAQLPSLLDGGALWFSNLSIPDPYFVLPIVSCLSMSSIIAFGGAEAEVGPASNSSSFRKFFMIMPIISIPFLIFQPSAMFAFWIVSNMYSVLLLLLFRTATVQRLSGIPERVKHDPSVLKEMEKQMNPMEMFRQLKKQRADLEDAKNLMAKVKKHEDTLKRVKRMKKE